MGVALMAHDWGEQLQNISDRAKLKQFIEDSNDDDSIIVLRTRRSGDGEMYAYRCYGPATIAEAALTAFRFQLYMAGVEFEK